MKVNVEMNISPSQLMMMIDTISIEQCKELITLINNRIENSNTENFVIESIAIDESFFEIPIDALGLSTRTFNILMTNKLETLKDINMFGLKQIKNLRHVGYTTLKEIYKAIAKYQINS